MSALKLSLYLILLGAFLSDTALSHTVTRAREPDKWPQFNCHTVRPRQQGGLNRRTQETTDEFHRSYPAGGS